MICYETSRDIIDWLAQFKLKEVVTIAGIITNEPVKGFLALQQRLRHSRESRNTL